MTAVEWLMGQITYDNGFGERRNSYTDSFDLKEFFEKAKEIEKQQMKEMYLKGIENYDPTFKNK